MSENNTGSRVYLAWLITTMFFFYQYMVRVFPNIISNEIFKTFKITAEEFGTLGSIYSLTYGIVQIPIGFLLDRVKIKKISLGAILLCIVGVIMFGMAQSFQMMQLGRVITAIGSGAALGITLKVISANFSGANRGILSGLTLTIGVIGPILGGKIFEYVLRSHDWRIAITIIGMSGFILFLLTLVGVKNIRYSVGGGFRETLSGIRHVFSLPVLLYSVIAGGTYAPVCVFADLWGSRFLSSKFGILETESVNISLSLYVGVAIGSLLLPFFAEKIRRLNLVIVVTLLCNSALFCIMIFSDQLDTKHLYVLVGLIGFFCGAEMICFNAAWYIVPESATGLAVGVINSFSIIFNAAFQHVVGMLMDMMWDRQVDAEGIRIYSQDHFTLAISSVPIVLMSCFLISLLLMRRIRKTNPS